MEIYVFTQYYFLTFVTFLSFFKKLYTFMHKHYIMNTYKETKMKKTKRYCISMSEELHAMIQKICKLMGMDFSSWLDFIARDKIAYFLRNSDKYMQSKAEPLSPEDLQFQEDIEKTKEIAKYLWTK